MNIYDENIYLTEYVKSLHTEGIKKVENSSSYIMIIPNGISRCGYWYYIKSERLDKGTSRGDVDITQEYQTFKRKYKINEILNR